MASLNGLPNELVFMIADHIETFDDIPDRERGLHSLALTNRRFHLMFNTALYSFDACNQRKAMAWGAFFGSVATMVKARAAGFPIDRSITHPAVSRAPGPCGPTFKHPTILALAGGRNNLLDWLQQRGMMVDRWTWAPEMLSLTKDVLPASPWWSLYWAIVYDHEHTVRYLLDRGVNPIVSTDEGRVSAMHVAAALGRDAMFDLLLSRPGCDLDAQDHAGNTPLHYAARGFFDIKCTDFNGNYPPRFANSTSIASLVRRGACLQATNDDGESPVVFALAKHASQWKAALQLLLLDPARFVPSEKLVTTAIAGARENVSPDKSEQWESNGNFYARS